jgi:hypothetical protein
MANLAGDDDGQEDVQLRIVKSGGFPCGEIIGQVRPGRNLKICCQM